jgi:hypothetical protein
MSDPATPAAEGVQLEEQHRQQHQPFAVGAAAAASTMAVIWHWPGEGVNQAA